MKYKVAVITRTKDRERFLERALDSVGKQTYRDYIHVIVNDGGDEDVVNRQVEALTADIKAKITVFHRGVSSGAPDTIFNESIERVDSDYIAIHDDDDTWHPDFLERTVELLEKGAEGVVVRTDKITEEINDGQIEQLKKSHYLPSMKVVSLYRQCAENQLTPIAFIYSRKAYLTVGRYDDSLPVVGDWEFGIRFLLKFDVEYLDPGFALANYHHRHLKQRDNSFSLHSHRVYFNRVANKYLRDELREGRIGPGYVISSLRYQESYTMGLVAKILPGKVSGWLKKRVKG